ncbi:MAG: hypothetical protein JWN52_3525 [Actinomycetia bacterium]|nr:hypothetical protein [Actinomycetes bacterium]
MESFPAIPLQDWAETKETLHRFLQVVGKIRLAAAVRRNHWWHVPFHLTGRGLTTRPMGQVDGNPIFAIDFDFIDHRLTTTTLDGRSVAFPLVGQSVASFHDRVHAGLDHLGVHVTIERDHPFDLPDAARPFAQDSEHADYDAAAVTRYWQVLSQIGLVLEEFSARFSGKISPVHHFWHTFDVAATRFSDRNIEQPQDVDPVTREAYSREVISSGFWFGDVNFSEPALYCYTAPEPDGLAKEPLTPAAAEWADQGSSHLAVLPYATARSEADPRAAMLDFYESAYQAGAHRAGWDVDRYACPGGVTDPQLKLGSQ